MRGGGEEGRKWSAKMIYAPRRQKSSRHHCDNVNCCIRPHCKRLVAFFNKMKLFPVASNDDRLLKNGTLDLFCAVLCRRILLTSMQTLVLI